MSLELGFGTELREACRPDLASVFGKPSTFTSGAYPVHSQ